MGGDVTAGARIRFESGGEGLLLAHREPFSFVAVLPTSATTNIAPGQLVFSEQGDTVGVLSSEALRGKVVDWLGVPIK